MTVISYDQQLLFILAINCISTKSKLQQNVYRGTCPIANSLQVRRSSVLYQHQQKTKH
jgi:hypothetical protein